MFDFVAVHWFENLRLWSGSLIEVTPLDNGPVRQGTRGVEVRRTKIGRSPPQPHGRTFEVTEFDPPRAFATTGVEDGGARSGYLRRIVFAPLGTRTRVTLRFEQEVELIAQVFWLFLNLKLRLELRRDLIRLRDALENP